MQRTATAVIVASLLAAGCLGTSGPQDTGAPEGTANTWDDEWAERAVPFGDDHDHFDPTQHQNLSTHNFELLGWDPLLSDHYGRTAGGHLCGDARDYEDRRLAAVHGLSTDVAFVLVDVTDPTAPEPLGEFVTPMSGSRDVALVPGSPYVVIAGTGPRVPDQTPLATLNSPPPAYWRDACGTHPVRLAPSLDGRFDGPLPGGAILVNVQDPDDMAIESIFPVAGPLGVHSIGAGSADDQTLVLVSVVNLAAAASSVYFLDVEPTPAGRQLVFLSEYQDLPHEGGGALINGHNDAWFQKHPVTGTPLVYVANWHQGMVILDMTNPRLPVVAGRWTDNPGPGTALVQDGRGNYHEAFPMNEARDGRHYTFVGQEILSHPTQTASGWVHVIDTTDPSRPERVASWTLPVDVHWDTSLVFSTHYVSYFENTLFVAHYHAGVWAVDLSGIGQQEILPAIGAFVPANASPRPPPESLSYDWSPTIMDAIVLQNGDLVVWDAASGVYTARFNASDPAPPRAFAGLSG